MPTLRKHCTAVYVTSCYRSFAVGNQSRRGIRRRQVDHELTTQEQPLNQFLGELASNRKEKGDVKGDAWNRLSGLSTFALCGISFFQTLAGAGTYNIGRCSEKSKHSVTEKERF